MALGASLPWNTVRFLSATTCLLLLDEATVTPEEVVPRIFLCDVPAELALEEFDE